MNNFGIDINNFQGNRTMRAIQEEYAANMVLNEAASKSRIEQAYMQAVIEEEHRREEMHQQFQLRFRAAAATNIQRRWRGIFFRHYSTFAKRQRALRIVAVLVWIKNKLPNSHFLQNVRHIINVRQEEERIKVEEERIREEEEKKKKAEEERRKREEEEERIREEEEKKKKAEEERRKNTQANPKSKNSSDLYATALGGVCTATLGQVMSVAIAPFCPWGFIPLIYSSGAVFSAALATFAGVDGTLLNLGYDRMFEVRVVEKNGKKNLKWV